MRKSRLRRYGRSRLGGTKVTGGDGARGNRLGGSSKPAVTRRDELGSGWGERARAGGRLEVGAGVLEVRAG
jgi:hypothetical protein